MTKVILHQLSGSKKALDACKLVEKLFDAGKRVVIWVADEGRAKIVDDYLWTYSQSTFIPHRLVKGGAATDDPIVIVTGTLSNPNDATVLVVADRLDTPQVASVFGEIHDLLANTAEDAGKKEIWEQAGFKVTEKRGIGG